MSVVALSSLAGGSGYETASRISNSGGWRGLLRTIGFSSAPGVLRIFGIIPRLGLLVNLLTSVWMLITMVIAVRQALDYHSTHCAIRVCIIGCVIQAALFAVIVSVTSGTPQPMLEN